ncbi:MAG TPA: UdgX family uracil-DNA binding protein [Actinomycetota bacterium]|jgi:uracil-DNA glycosylase|nr:UdgX family uracil-DNA binding protein [Actinomycetota bacterium]
MADDASAWVPRRAGVPRLREVARTCRGCELWRSGTQTVFGEGSSRARIMLVGEQPGDREDIEGRPFVGPAGRLLKQALDHVGIPLRDVYLTNVVKHFRWEARGKKRIHRKPSLAHVRACEPWLRAEMRAVRPDIVVLMGATAAQSMLGTAFRVTQHRGKFVPASFHPLVTATVHPSSILRARDQDRASALDSFEADLRFAAQAVTPRTAPPRSSP